MFSGSYDHVLDEKGRTSLPKDFREILKGLKGDPWITAFRQCLNIFPPDEFEAFSIQLSAASQTIEDIQRLQRLILGMAARIPVDGQGRILIPPKLRKWACLDREIVFTGVGRTIEVWDRCRHEADLEQTRELYPAFTDTLKGFGL
jgi:MraZ protein